VERAGPHRGQPAGEHPPFAPCLRLACPGRAIGAPSSSSATSEQALLLLVTYYLAQRALVFHQRVHSSLGQGSHKLLAGPCGILQAVGEAVQAAPERTGGRRGNRRWGGA